MLLSYKRTILIRGFVVLLFLLSPLLSMNAQESEESSGPQNQTEDAEAAESEKVYFNEENQFVFNEGVGLFSFKRFQAGGRLGPSFPLGTLGSVLGRGVIMEGHFDYQLLRVPFLPQWIPIDFSVGAIGGAAFYNDKVDEFDATLTMFPGLITGKLTVALGNRLSWNIRHGYGGAYSIVKREFHDEIFPDMTANQKNQEYFVYDASSIISTGFSWSKKSSHLSYFAELEYLENTESKQGLFLSFSIGTAFNF